MITQMIRKQFFSVKDVRAIGRPTPREFLCVVSVQSKYHLKAPELHKIIPASKTCETDVLCNWKIMSQII